MKVVALAGGVGGARFADGLYRVLPHIDLTVIVNTGDDFEHEDLWICPDVDTVCYTLARLGSLRTGWGRKGESWQALKGIQQLGGPTWFRLGDRDLATHLERTRRLKAGQPLSQVTADFCTAWNIGCCVLPMSDQKVSTIVHTKTQGELGFQDYFVRLGCEPEVTGFHFEGSQNASPAPGVIEAIEACDVVIICPSNPWVSLAPIFVIPGILSAIQSKPVVAVSPIIGGKAVKGPLAKMFTELGIQPSALAVAEVYRNLLRGFVIDVVDAGESSDLEAWGIMTLITDILIPTPRERMRLAREVLAFCENLLWRKAP